MTDRLAIILHGVAEAAPRPDDADTLVQAREIGAALEALGYRVETRALDLDLGAIASLAADPPTLVFNLVESLGGRDGNAYIAAALLAARGLPFTGADATTLMLCADKPLAKNLLRAAGIDTPDWGVGDPHLFYIVKSTTEQASFGIDKDSVVPGNAAAALIAAKGREHGGQWFAERYVEGREFNLALLEAEDGPQILPIAEMTFLNYAEGEPKIVDYAAKWTPDDPHFSGTVRRFDFGAADAPLLARLREMALACWACFKVRGYARVDFRVDGDGRPFVLEVNPNPCLAADAGFVAAAAKAGLSQRDIVARLATMARRR